MRKMIKLAIGATLLGGAMFGVWDYTSPYRTVQGFRSAILNRDGVALNGYIDFDALRSNLKAQFAARLMGNNVSRPGLNPEYAATRLQSVEAMVDGLVSPQAIRLGMERVAQQTERNEPEGSIGLQPIRRDGFNQFHLPLDPDDTIAVRFERRGLSWQVTDVKLPYDLHRAFARPTDTAMIPHPE
ncbi:DUF2939 domain-containing protein [Sphingomonas sp. BT-65]|uniref:DUF2939 domain-containing protein n=1 Tax=Sphingomonas sp. BT-65 TaxID=2989821 RepID=UPI00223624D4|nr:DUF2939 domain-containing protein [Sphingomonas sp. BT-65]MCW4463104.1 DUF2939 domain-containing protein [Sphingomonas sp. BT-65]